MKNDLTNQRANNFTTSKTKTLEQHQWSLL